MNDRTRRHLQLAIYALTIFTSASLLFVVQPMVGKLILPHLGGSSSVWTTCMLFFQSMLVAGYIYAHLIAQRISPRRQVMVHGALIVGALVTSLPFTIAGGWVQSQSMPALWLLAALLASIGLPLFVVSSSAPLFQHWFSFTDHPDANDPYYLYSASNVGSMLALFGYPFVVERTLAVDTQTRLWAWGFGGLGLLAMGSGAFVWGQRARPTPSDETETDKTAEDKTQLDRVGWTRRGRWLLITFIPSSLMLGVTAYLTTDIASVPLLWVFPLGLYLLSFIVAFARLRLPLKWLRAGLPVAAFLVLASTFGELFGMTTDVLLHLGLFFLVALYFHGELAEDRPSAGHLTEFYIWMSVGGALGGVFNALVAPALFSWMIDYYLMLAVAVAAIFPLRNDPAHRTGTSAAIGGCVLAVTLAVFAWSVGLVDLDYPGTIFGMSFVAGALVVVALQFPPVQNVGLALILLLGCTIHADVSNETTYRRSFFADYTVYPDYRDGVPVRVFAHGTTLHGIQARQEPVNQRPIGYYHPAGPLGDIFEALPSRNVAVAGLGSGGMAAYAGPDTRMHFFEIDPVVEDIARTHFSYLEHCGMHCRVDIGDARNLLEASDPGSFDLLFMDAYNSDSVPTHLLTREALELYMSRLDDDGVAVFHVSNRYLDVEGIVGRLADESGLVARTRTYYPSETRGEPPKLAYGSVYTIVARHEADLGPLAQHEDWGSPRKADVLWTDQFTNIVSVLDW